MIHTNSLIDGFPVILGSLPIQFAMTLAMIIAIRVPKDEDGTSNPHCKFIYWWVLSTHLLILVCQSINHYLGERWHLMKKQLTIVCLMVQLLMINTICGEWIFEDGQHKAADHMTQENWIQFDVWIVLEACVFLSYIGSAIMYLFIRAFKDAEHNLSTGNAISTTYSDSLEHSAVNLQCFESFFAPLFATGLLRSHLFDFSYQELMRDHSACNIICECFIYFSVVQVVLALMLNFIPVW